MPGSNRLTIEILGTSFSIRANEDEAYLKRILWYLEKKIEETRSKTPITDPVKVSILTSFYIIDELLREKERDGHDPYFEDESREIEKITMELITELDNAIDS
jgi:cell division protein ZapA (FtsZ GTPase activity inhibitor)